MIGYYELTEKIYSHLRSDEDINTVKIGSIDSVDEMKQIIYPFAHILTTSANFINGVIRFTVTISCMDVINVTKEDLREQNEKLKGIDNKQDILNTMLAVVENLNRELIKGDLQDDRWELQGDITAEPFEDRFIDLVTGWSATFTIDIPNTVQNCDGALPFNPCAGLQSRYDALLIQYDALVIQYDNLVITYDELVLELAALQTLYDNLVIDVAFNDALIDTINGEII